MKDLRTIVETLKERWPIIVAALFVLLGFIFREAMLDNANDQEHSPEAALGFSKVSDEALQSSGYDVAQYSSTILAGFNNGAPLDKAHVASVIRARLYAASRQTKIGETLEEALVFPSQSIANSHKLLANCLAEQRQLLQAYEQYGPPFFTDPRYLNSQLDLLNQLLADATQYSVATRTEAKQQIGLLTQHQKHLTWITDGLFFMGWALTYGFKLSGKDYEFTSQ